MNNRERESRDALARLKQMKERSRNVKDREALDLAITLLIGRVTDAENEEE